jgi:hypothetical protein
MRSPNEVFCDSGGDVDGGCCVDGLPDGAVPDGDVDLTANVDALVTEAPQVAQNFASGRFGVPQF